MDDLVSNSDSKNIPHLQPLSTVNTSELFFMSLKEDKNIMLGFLKNQYEFANKTLGQVDLQKTIDGMRKVTDTPPTGKVTFGVGITNIGDADGVIQKVGQLKFDPYELPLYCDEFTVVKAHSFMRIRFNINEATDKADALKNWKEAVLRNDVPKYLITLNLNSEPFSKFSDDK